MKLFASKSPEPGNITFWGKGDCVDVMESRIWGWGDYSGLSKSALIIVTSFLIKQRKKIKERAKAGKKFWR